MKKKQYILSLKFLSDLLEKKIQRLKNFIIMKLHNFSPIYRYKTR